MPCQVRFYVIVRELAESWAVNVERAGFMVQLEEISPDDANVGCRSLGRVVRGKEKVEIVTLAPTPRDTGWFKIKGTDLPEDNFLMYLMPCRVSFWPWSARSNDLCTAVEEILVAKGAKDVSDTSAYEIVRLDSGRGAHLRY